MADKDVLWTAVKAGYAVDQLIPLTNIMDRAVNAIDDAVGTSAAEQVLGLWELYAEFPFDVLDVRHLAVGIRAVVAVLYERGGFSADIAREEWQEIFSDSDGLLSRLRRTEARSRTGPSISGPDLSADGKELRPYSHDKSMPVGFMPSTRTVVSDD